MEKENSFARALINRVAVFLGLIVLTFFLPRLLPGDPLELMLVTDFTQPMTPDAIEILRLSHGLAGSSFEQFGRYLWKLAHGDLGYSLQHAMPVSDLIWQALPWTLLLISGAIPVYLFFGLLGGIEAGLYPHSLRDRIVTGGMITLASIPPFAIAIFLLLIFGVIWPVFPISGAEPLFPSANLLTRISGIAQHAVLPIVALALHELTRFFFLARAESVGLSVRPFMINARARGINGRRIRLNYHARNILPITLARMGDSVTTLFGTVFFVEAVFAYPGVGSLVFSAILERDYILLQGAMLELSLVVLLLNWGLDSLVSRLVRRG